MWADDVKERLYFNVVAQALENTVVTEYEPVYFGIGGSAALAGMEQEEAAGIAPSPKAISLVTEDSSAYCHADAGESLRH